MTGDDVTGGDAGGRGLMSMLPGRIGAPVRTTGGGGTTLLPATDPTPVNESATAFAARSSMDSPGRILSLATTSAILPAWRSMVALPGTSVIVRVERSCTVTTALPPSSMRAID